MVQTLRHNRTHWPLRSYWLRFCIRKLPVYCPIFDLLPNLIRKSNWCHIKINKLANLQITSTMNFGHNLLLLVSLKSSCLRIYFGRFTWEKINFMENSSNHYQWYIWCLLPELFSFIFVKHKVCPGDRTVNAVIPLKEV